MRKPGRRLTLPFADHAKLATEQEKRMSKTRTIDCPDCDGVGNLGTEKQWLLKPNGRYVEVEVIVPCTNPHCNEGVVLINMTDEK